MAAANQPAKPRAAVRLGAKLSLAMEQANLERKGKEWKAEEREEEKRVDASFMRVSLRALVAAIPRAS